MDSALLAGRVGVAGLGLGAFSTTKDLIGTVHAAFGAWNSYRNADNSVGYFRTLLLMQKSVLASWQCDWYGDAQRDRATIGKLRLLKAHDETVKSVLAQVQKELDALSPMQVLEVHREELCFEEKMTWLTGQEEKARAGLERVESLLGGLYRLLPPQSPHLETQILINSVQDQIDPAAVSAAQDLPKISQITNLRILQQDLDEELSKRVTNWQTSAQGVTGLTTVKPLSLRPEEGTGGTRSLASVSGKTYMVEWKDYAVLQGSLGVDLRGRRDNLVQMLKAEPKPEEMLTLRCTGYFDDIDQQRYGYVFEVPTSGNESTVSLNSLIREPTSETLPPLQQRFYIAYRLALSLSILFFTGWLHKGLRSHNIIFIRNSHEVRWAQIYLCGFAYSRPDKQGEHSERLAHSERFNVYRHPKTQDAPRPDYRKAFDVYSFGVLLFEIATWRPAFKLWQLCEQNATKFQKEITSESTLNRVAHAMGTDYRDAMLKCLDGSFDHDGDVTRSFFQEVVEVFKYLV